MENETYTIILKKSGQQKLLAVKTIREACGLSLKESNDIVNLAPSIVKSGMTHDEAAHMKDALEAPQYDAVFEMVPDTTVKEVMATMPHDDSAHSDKGNKGCMSILIIPLALATAAAVITLL